MSPWQDFVYERTCWFGRGIESVCWWLLLVAVVACIGFVVEVSLVEVARRLGL